MGTSRDSREIETRSEDRATRLVAPSYSYRELKPSLTLAQLQEPEERLWLEAWVAEKKKYGRPMIPIQLYPGKLRGNQGYLVKMPLDFVERWPELGAGVDQLATRVEQLTALGEVVRPPRAAGVEDSGEFRPKSDADYVAIIRGGEQRRSRKHEFLVRRAGEILRAKGATVSTPHPIDLLVTSPVEVLFEVKVVRDTQPLFAIRDALGQLLQYRFFIRAECPNLCVLLDENPGSILVHFLESLDFSIAWIAGEEIRGGPQTLKRLSGIGIT